VKVQPIDPYAARDIQEQVDKVLRGLGNPEPPLDLRDVRELLKLDRQFYSSSKTGALRETVSKIKIGVKQLALRPSLLLEVVTKAGLRALWLPDRKRILINDEIPEPKKRHAEAHEITHSITPHHRLFFFGDDGETLRESCHAKLEAEANFGSGQLLFLRERFVREARDLPRTLATVRATAEKFGNTITMTLWRLVEEAHGDAAIFGIVSGHPKHPTREFNPAAPCRYFIESPRFRERFGDVTEVEAFEAMQGYATGARGGPLGAGEVVFRARDGQRHRFQMESFYNGYEALTLGVHLGPMPVQVGVQEMP
jgi:hypothetical protein